MPWARILQYQRFLKLAHASGKRVVWTCHNLEAHEDRTWPVRVAFRVLARAADLLICHDEASRLRCEMLYSPPGAVMVMPYGNYAGVYPHPRPRERVLAELELPADTPLLLCIGQVRPYKGTDIACEAVAALAGAVSLLIAGKAPATPFSARVRRRAASLPNTVLVDRHLTDQEFADFVGASEVVLLPYRSVTGSSAALAALTLGRGVLASNLPFFTGLFQGHPSAGRVVPSQDPHALAQAVVEFLAVPFIERERSARALAARFDWPRVVSPVAEALRGLLSRGM